MRDRSLRASVYVLLLLVVVIGVFVSFPKTTATARRLKNRTINRLPLERNRPIGIVGVKIRGSDVLPNRGLIEDDDWLEGLVIRIRNRSDKDIVFASIDLQFPRPAGSEGPFAIDEITFGNRELASRLTTISDSADRIIPKQTSDLRLSASQVDDIKSLLTATGYPSEGPDDVRIRIGTVVFSDGTMWRIGTRLRRKSEGEPGKWVAEEDPLTARRETPLQRQRNGRSFAFLPAGFSHSKVFEPFSSNVQTSCKALDATTFRPCMEYEGCAVWYDWVSTTTPGFYYRANAYSLCKSQGESCQIWQSVIVANSCVSGGAGGGGGGYMEVDGGGGGDYGECTSNWDCNTGYSCNVQGQCE